MHQPNNFWDKHAVRYAKSTVSDEDSYQKKLQLTREYLRPEMEVLEFGCGTGSTAIAHAPHVKHIQAIDVSSKMLEIAQGKADAKKIGNISFELSNIDEFSVPAQTFDAVLALSILHLLKNKEEVVSKVHRMLKPGGIFVTSTICLGDTKMRFIRFVAPIGKALGLLPVLRVFTVRDLVDSLTRAGFTIDHQWQPGKSSAVFIVAKKAG